VPRLGILKVTAASGDSLKIETVQANQNPLFTGCDRSVKVNGVDYRFSLPTFNAARLNQMHSRAPSTPIILTTDDSWGARPADLTAKRIGGPYFKAVTPAATQTITKRCVMFLDSYLQQPIAARLLVEGDRYARNKQAIRSRTEIERLRRLLAEEERRLADALRADVHDLLALREAIERDDDVYHAIHQIEPKDT